METSVSLSVLILDSRRFRGRLRRNKRRHQWKLCLWGICSEFLI